MNEGGGSLRADPSTSLIPDILIWSYSTFDVLSTPDKPFSFWVDPSIQATQSYDTPLNLEYPDI
ncbi:hypothetical protein B0J17DRAFT_685815 [Rhizoctonia solani]|nr:hypothetical protein B0J17DRAFT_685815 [Rhizoctonia solani]